MPYVKQMYRNRLDPYIEALSRVIATPGDMNYVINKLAYLIVEQEGICYNNLNAMVGCLDAAKLEFYRRVVAPYEDAKVKENGDIYNRFEKVINP